MAVLQKLIPKVHCEPVKVNNGADDYCLKEDTRVEGPWEFGEKPIKRNSKVDWDKVKEQALKGDFMEIPADVLVKHYNNLRRINADLGPTPEIKRTEKKINYWYWGKTGTGKTRKIYEDHKEEDIYQKDTNKWWCKYQGQKVIVMEELGRDAGKCLVQHIKKWADPWYNHGGEIKQSNVRPMYDFFYVTTQFSIDDLDIHQDDKEALKRRFTQIEFKKLM